MLLLSGTGRAYAAPPAGDVRRGNRAQSLQREPDLSADGWPQDGWEHFLQIERQWRDLIFPSPSPGKGLGQRLLLAVRGMIRSLL